MKRFLVIIACILLIIITSGCVDEMEIGREEQHRKNVENIRTAVEEELDESVLGLIRIDEIRSDMCEGEEVAVSMMLDESGLSPNFDDHDSVEVVDVTTEEGNDYKIIYLDGEKAVVPERYK